tara:strand:- start:96 stop:422 length:327 start_codon:yes stop_codon:yes gene_type:complete
MSDFSKFWMDPDDPRHKKLYDKITDIRKWAANENCTDEETLRFLIFFSAYTLFAHTEDPKALMMSLDESLYLSMISSAPFNENIELEDMEEFKGLLINPFLEDESTIH